MKQQLAVIVLFFFVFGECNFAFGAESVTPYGVIDIGIESADGGYGPVHRLVSGSITPSRFGIAGSEEIAAGSTVIFKIEGGFSPTDGKPTQGGKLFGREVWLGLDGSAGKLIAGVTYTPLLTILGTYSLQADSDGLGWGHAINNFAGPATRVSNSLRYSSPNLNGFIFRGDYAFPSPSNNLPAQVGRTASESIGYRSGPVSLDIAYITQEFAPGTTITSSTPLAVANYATIGASYDFGLIKPAFVYVRNSGGPDVASANSAAFSNPHSSIYEIDAVVPAGNGLWLGSIGRFVKQADSHGDAVSYGIRYNCAFSRAVTVYAGYAEIRNGTLAKFSVRGQSDPGVPVAIGSNVRAVVAGLQKAF